MAAIAVGKGVGHDSQIDVVVDSLLDQDKKYMGLVKTKLLTSPRITEHSLQNKIFWQMSSLKF